LFHERKYHKIEAFMEGTRKQLIEIVKEANRSLVADNPSLSLLQHGALSKDDWRAFAIQRFLIATPFEGLLREGIRKAAEHRLDALQSSLEKNLHDEIGIDENGSVRADRAHSTWRKEFYAALGIVEQELAMVQPIQGTAKYLLTLQQIINGDVFVIAGALLVLEATIPGEFRKLQEGRDRVFPEAFVESPDDSDEVRESKKRARLYIDDHIWHDARSHYPDLLSAIVSSVSTAHGLESVKEGMAKVGRAKKAFYDDLGRIF
jgi:hypothetical protein